jgi:spore germination cell wall hydrolase CwlJ-like protein
MKQVLMYALLTATICMLFSLLSLSLSAQTLLEEEVDCLAEALYFEARSESFIAQLAVGNVIYNRVKSSKFPNTFCDVVRQSNKTKKGKLIKNKCQFSYYCDGKKETIYDVEAYKKAVSISHLVMEGVVIEHIRDALYYHASYVRPYWSKNKKYLGKVGLHNFYK